MICSSKFSSQITPGTIYHVDLEGDKPKVTVHLKTKVHNFTSSDFKVKQVFYPSADGTKIPMFITMRKDFVPDASSPCLLYGYGGFSINMTPSFNTVQFFTQHFGIMAIANIRGEGKYGESWSNGGKLANLQNCLMDFQCAAEFLIKEQYTAKEKLTIYRGSHGGMPVGACANQRPELYGAMVSAVVVMGMLRFHKFTVGYAWDSNYETLDDDGDINKFFAIKFPAGLTFNNQQKYDMYINTAVMMHMGNMTKDFVPVGKEEHAKIFKEIEN